MKDALFAWKEGNNVDLKTVKTEIRRNKLQKPIVYSKLVKKRYSVVYDKRQVLDNFTTIPYGY